MNVAVQLARPTTTARPALSAHLRRLESEAIEILREVAATACNPVMLYSIGKDSGVMLHLAAKAFYPAPPPFPLLHVDTTWKFREMIIHRDTVAAKYGVKLLVHVNTAGLARGISPVASGSTIHTQVMKTEALKQALELNRFDVAFGGARRDEEKSRAKERIFSVRNAEQAWDPRRQRPELWRLWNSRINPGESLRVFPLSNWTELDVWEYTRAEAIPVVPLYYSALRPVVRRDGALGDYPLSAAVESDADDLDSLIAEVRSSRQSERQGRLIDADETASMERKKREGYF